MITMIIAYGSHTGFLEGKNMQVSEQREELVSFVELKQLARRHLPSNSFLRNILLSEPDLLPKQVALGKVEIYIPLLYEELKQC